ncbi:MAG: hypothetical protein H7146_04165, partial [Burkholderiaceae bacterium]|nr:hypothetical protein [Microbacteriaceae bacterium]
LQYAQIENGYLFVGVAFDDGSVQDAVDGWYGRDMVAVVSLLREVG